MARRIAIRVSRSGAVRSAIRPHSNRLRRRSSSVDDLLRRPVRREDDLLPVLVDRVERVEELLLGALLVGDELDVVDQEEVDAPVAGPEVVDPALLDARDELVRELLAGGVHDLLAREAGDHRVPDRVHQVRLAEANPAVQEERVVGVPGALGHRQGGGMREPVGRPHDEVREGVPLVETGRPSVGTDPRRLDPDLLGRHRRRLGRCAGVLPDHELHLDAVAHHAGQGLRDQGPVAGLEPVLGEAVRHRDPEARVLDVDERRVAEPGLEVGGRQRDLELPERCAPDVLRVHEDPVRPGAGGAGWRWR